LRTSRSYLVEGEPLRVNRMRWFASAMILLPLLAGGSIRCPEPDYPDIRECPFPVDPNLVVGKLLGWVRLEVGRELIHTRTWCDAEGDPATVKILDGPKGVKLINKPRTSSYTLLWTPKQPTTTAIVVQVTDKPASGQPKSDTGTLLVQVVPRGQHLIPTGCGGRPR
jgi:hypothetical protein